MANFVVSTVLTDDLAELSIMTSAGKFTTRIGSQICKEPVLEMLMASYTHCEITKS